MRFYLQAASNGGLPSLRCYNEAGRGWRWVIKDREWSSQCASEKSCQITGDREITREAAEQWLTEQMQAAAPAVKEAA